MDDGFSASEVRQYTRTVTEDERYPDSDSSYAGSDASPTTGSLMDNLVGVFEGMGSGSQMRASTEAGSAQGRAQAGPGTSSTTPGPQKNPEPTIQQTMDLSSRSRERGVFVSQNSTLGLEEIQEGTDYAAESFDPLNEARTEEGNFDLEVLPDSRTSFDGLSDSPRQESNNGTPGHNDMARGNRRRNNYERLVVEPPYDVDFGSNRSVEPLRAVKDMPLEPPSRATILTEFEYNSRDSTSLPIRGSRGSRSISRSGRRPSQEVRDIVLPRWQPDAEVTFCPICRTQFSFFVRKHHCRKCGRVVCNACSPHRITIPYQYIVQPPLPATTSSMSTHTAENMDDRNPEVPADLADKDGGMKVRLCNPCVPDPNPMPPQPQFDDENGNVPTLFLRRGTRPYSFTGEPMSSGPSGQVRLRGQSTASVMRVENQLQTAIPQGDEHARSSSIHNSGEPYRASQTGRYPNYVPRDEIMRGSMTSGSLTNRASHSTLSGNYAQVRGHGRGHQSLSFTPGGSTSNPQPHYRSLLDVGSDASSGTSLSSNRPLPPTPSVNEEDVCPVCHRVLLSRGLPDFENRKAAHIMQCIDEQIAINSGNSSRPRAHTTHSAPAPTPTLSYQPMLSSQQPGQPAHQPIPANTAQPQPILPNTPEARTAAREQAHAAVVFSTNSNNSPAGGSSSQDILTTPRRTGMFVYRASEKDCVDDAECTICLEEFEVGAPMARLECFCRFHRKCIGDWFVDHPGRCPVHQHDGFGF